MPDRSDWSRRVFAFPLVDDILLSAPLSGLSALANAGGARLLGKALLGSKPDPAVASLADQLLADFSPLPPARTGSFIPSLLGILPTRRCHLACRYCGFLPDGNEPAAMETPIIEAAVGYYLSALARENIDHGEVHFFGGEPFFAPEALQATVRIARAEAARQGIRLRFFAITNGIFSEEMARWAAESLDSIVLSLDGPPDIQDHHRPRRDGGPTYEIAARTARILAEGPVALYLRACVTAQTVSRLPAIARDFCEEFRPQGICFEPLQPPDFPLEGMTPPDPWAFIRAFYEAAAVMAAYGVTPIHASADLSAAHASFCPVGNDALIVSPGGDIAACYLMKAEWEARGFDLVLGRIEGDQVMIDNGRVERIRRFNVHEKPFCQRCFLQFACAGGCHVNHPLPEPGGAYDARCIEARGLGLLQLALGVGGPSLAESLLDDEAAFRRAVLQPDDSIFALLDEKRP